MELIPHTMDAHWRNTVTQGPWRSRHFVLVILFNALNVISLFVLWRLLHTNPVVGPYLQIFLLVMVFLLLYAGWYAYQAYRTARETLAGAELTKQVEESVLQLSYFVFRVYLVGLVLAFVVVESANLIIPKLL